jgi:hypothetical protein
MEAEYSVMWGRMGRGLVTGVDAIEKQKKAANEEFGTLANEDR